MKALSFLNNIVPYHDVRWRNAAPMFSRCLVVELTNRDEFKALEFQQESMDLYERVTLFSDRNRNEVSNKRLAQEVRRILTKEKPDVIFVNGYSFFYNWVALEWGCRNETPVVICSESNEHDEPRSAFKEAVKRFFVSRCSSGLAGGTPQADYLKKLGLPSERVFTGYDVVDNEYFEFESRKVRSWKSEARDKLRLPDRYFFTCARFGEKKNIPRLISAYALFCRRFCNSAALQLVIAGDGEEKQEIERAIAEHDLSEKVHLVGSKSYEELPGYYALAEGFIHASTTEQWGLVVNEAMASGLPVLVSNRCGCATDLVQEGVNGWTFDPMNVEQLAELMAEIASDPSRREQMGKKSHEIISQWGAQRFAQGVAASVEAAFLTSKPNYGLIERLIFTLRAL